ncbi:MAG: ribulose-phosphate 3-epimerase [Anaerovoracaceae bacterium]|jgi:ribulose-phosphate 3-epimerase
MKEIAPSILSADFSRLGEDIAAAKRGGARIIHFDVMDGHFVPNISYGPVVLEALEHMTDLSFDVHLMIERPDDLLEKFVTGRTEYITVHQEACVHLDRTISHIKSLGVKAGVAINPATPVAALRHVLEQADLILVMSVNPGFAGQKFIQYTLDKTRELNRIRKESGFGFTLEMDGGIGPGNIREVINAGTDIAVAGSAVFGADDIENTTKRLIAALEDR